MKENSALSTDPDDLYNEVTAELVATAPVKSGKMFGMPCLKHDESGKAFAGFYEGAMVFKLTGVPLSLALQLSGAHLFDPMGGRPMKEWVEVPAEHAARWSELAREALRYVVNDLACGSYTHLVNRMLQSYEELVRKGFWSGWRVSRPSADEICGNWAECSNTNAGWRAIASKFQPKFFGLKLRHNFHLSSSFPDNRIFFGGKDAIQVSIHGLVSSAPGAVQARWFMA